MKIRSKHNYDRENHRPKKMFTKPSRVCKEFQADCDIDKILRKYAASGTSPFSTEEQNTYTSHDVNQDYQYWQNQIIKTKEDFMRLSAENRAHFKHDPSKFLLYMQDPDNYQDGVNRGIFIPPKEEEAAPAAE